MTRRRLVLAAVIVLAVLGGAISPARSAFPGVSGKVVFTSDRGGSTELWTIEPVSGAMRQLTTFGPDSNPVETPAWSPGGDEIAFSQGGYVFAYDVADATVRAITDTNSSRFDTEPTWSPDGTMLAVTSVDGIWRVNADGSGLVQLTDGRDRDPAWSPDGGTIAFTRLRHSGSVSAVGEDVYLMNPDGSGQVRLTEERLATDPTWSPDGGKIAYVRRVNEQTDIVVRDVDDPDAHLIAVTSSPEHEFRPAWSPDGTKIVYEQGLNGGTANELLVANADGSGGETTLPNGVSGRWPDWERVTSPVTGATCSIASTRVDEGGTGQAQALFEVDCDNATTDTLRVGYATADRTAHGPSDYAPAVGGFDVLPGKTHRRLAVDVFGDVGPEPHETLALTLSSSVVVIARPTATATIVDDDGFGVAVETESVQEGDLGSTDVEIGVDLSHAADRPITVTLVGFGSTISTADYELLSPMSLTFDAGELHEVLTLRVHGDSAFEGDESLEILPLTRHVDDANLASGRLTILDDDEASLSIDDVTVTEGDSGMAMATFTVTRSHVDGAVAFDFATEDGSATAGDDYVADGGPVSFSDGAPTADIRVPVHGDVLDEPDETFRVRLSNPSGGTVADGVGVATITDDDAEPVLSIDDASVVEGDGGITTARVDVRLSAPSSSAVTVDYATADGTATAPGDYIAIAPTDLTFVPGGPTTRSVDVLVAGDTLPEGDEEFSVVLDGAVNASIADRSATGTIVDDDAEPQLSIHDLSVLESDAGGTTARFTVDLSRASATTVTVDYATVDGTATAPGDYTAVPTTSLSFAPGTTRRTLEVLVTGDGFPEAEESFAVVLSGAQNAGIRSGRATGRILDDDRASDGFIDAPPLGTGPEFFNTSVATVESGEPGLVAATPSSYPSVWFQTSPGRGGLELHATSHLVGPSPGPLRVSVYRGSSLSSLTLVARAETPAFPSRPAVLDEQTVDLALFTEGGGPALPTYYIQIVGASASTLGPAGGTGGTLTHVFHPAPANDDFAQAADLGGQGVIEFDTSFATVQADEPNLPPHGSSVWFRLQSSGVALHLQYTPSSPIFVGGHRLTVYRGSSLDPLTIVKEKSPVGFPSSPSLSSIDLALPVGSYYIQVLGPRVCGECSGFPGSGVPPGPGEGSPFNPGAGEGILRFEKHNAPQNDNRAHAHNAPVSPVSFDTSFATLEPGEPEEPGQVPGSRAALPSVWVGLPAFIDGGLQLHAVGDQQPGGRRAAVLLSVYEASPGGALTHIATQQTAAFPFFDAGSGVDLNITTRRARSYLVQIRGHGICAPCTLDRFAPGLGSSDFMPGVGAGTLSWTFHPAPANDRFADAATLLDGPNPADTSFATVEPDEPGLVPPPRAFPSVWYRVDPGLGSLRLRTGIHGPEFRAPHRVSVYTGSTPSALTLVGRAATSGFPDTGGSQSLDLDVATGCETYHVQVGGRAAWEFLDVPWQSADVDIGKGTLTRTFLPTPLRNDAFVDAASLTVGRTVLPERWWTCAAAQPGEPAHGGTPAARSVWYRATVGSGRVTVDSPGNRVAVYQGTSLTSLTRIADGSPGKASFLTPGGTYLIAVDGGSGTTVDLELTPGEVVTAPGGAVTTDSEGQPPDGATPGDPIETTLGGGVPGPRTIFETQGATPPTAWSFLAWKVEIEAPPSTPTSPYTLTFRIDASLLAGMSSPLDVFRNGVAVPRCSPPPVPDPCVFSRTSVSGDQIIIVRTSRASEWTFGAPRTMRGTALGLLRPSSGGDAEFLAASNGTTVVGALSYGRSGERFVATTVSALAIDGNIAWLAGVGRDRRTFLAYIEDKGTGSRDRFRLWIGGVEQTDPSGTLTSGGTVIRP